MSRTIMVMAGGTGGHVMPGLAVAEAMRERGWSVVWMGNPAGMEATLVPRHGIPMHWVRFGGLRGKGLKTKLALPFTLMRAMWQALREIRSARPAVVLCMGGYIAFPGALMARLLRIPVVVHEQNAIAGMVNKAVSRIATRVLVAFPDALPGSQWCGNPIRSAITALPEPAQRFSGREGRLRLLVVGGSLGAAALNETVPKALTRLPADARPIVTHQSGKAHRQALQSAYRNAGIDANLVEFIDDMAAAYGEADLVVCRAGAMTVSELAAVGVASVLVPFPHAVDDHQSANARYLSERGAALLVQQNELTPDRLAELLRDLDRTRLLEMAVKAREAARPQAAAQVADICEAVARK